MNSINNHVTRKILKKSKKSEGAIIYLFLISSVIEKYIKCIFILIETSKNYVDKRTLNRNICKQKLIL